MFSTYYLKVKKDIIIYKSLDISKTNGWPYQNYNRLFIYENRFCS